MIVVASRSKGSAKGFGSGDCRRDVAILSPQFLALLGDRPEDAPQTSWQEFLTRVHPDDVAPLQAALQQHLEQRVPYKVEGRVQHRDGHYIWFRIRGQAFWDDEGQPVRMVGTIEDVSDRKHLEQELIKALEFRELLFNESNDALFWSIPSP